MEKLEQRVFNYESATSALDRVTIIAPSSGYGIKGAKRIFDRMRGCSDAVLLMDPEREAMYSARGPVILLGNLSDSRCMKELYYKQLAVTDLYYPGPGGYEIRTLVDPFGTGFNIIQMGYSDEDGLEKAVNLFCSEIKPFPIKYFKLLSPTRLHIPEGKVRELLDSSYSLDDPTIAYTAPIDDIGYLAYLTGDAELLDKYHDSWRALFKVEFNHLKLLKRVAAWRLLEVTGMIAEDMRSDIINFLYMWADGAEGIGSILHKIYQSPDYPRQNHGLIPAMGLVLLSDYFSRYYPGLQRPGMWREAADNVFSVYFNGSWKPLCDGLCHGWWLSQPAMLEYGLFDDRHRYMESGGARKAAFCAMAVVNNEGWLPNAGDCSITRQFPGQVLDMTSEYYKDGKARFVSNLAPVWRRGYSGPAIVLPKMFDIGIKPEEPAELTGVTVIPMDPKVYNAWRDYPDMAHMVSDTPPAAPIEKCFDKLAVRTGFKPEDEFLLIDGLGGGSHSYPDAMAILDYQRYGVSFIVSEDQLYWTEPENHSMVTIYKDGKADTIPAFAELEKIDRENDGSILISMLLKNNNGADWRREIYFIPDQLTVIHDTVIANNEGNYSLETHFRMPGTVDLTGNSFYSKRKTKDGKEVGFSLQLICSHRVNCSVREIPLNYSYRTLPGEKKPPSMETDPYEYAKMRYHLNDDNIVLSACTAKTSVHMNKGGVVSFTALLLASDTAEDISMKDVDGRILAKIEHEIFPAAFDRYGTYQDTGRESGKSAIPAKGIFESDSGITAAKTVDGKLWCGLHSGDILNVGVDGKVERLPGIKGQIHDFSLHKGFIYAGCGTNTLVKMTEKGQKVWQIETERIPTIYPWWELDLPSVMGLQIARYRGRDILLAGCGDNYVRFYGLDGNLINSYYFFAAVPNILRTCDVDMDGKDEILIAGSILTCISSIEVLNEDGGLVHTFGSEGWTSIARVVEVFDLCGKRIIALGVNHRNNFKLYQYDRKEKLIVSDRLAGAVTGIACNGNAGIIAAGTDQGFITAYEVTGEQRWNRMIDGAISDIKYFKDLFWLADECGYVHAYDKDGILIKTVYLGQNMARDALKLQNTDDVMYAITKRKVYLIETE